MISYEVRFNGSMDDLSDEAQAAIARVLEAEIETDNDDDDDALWLVTTEKDLTPQLMNSALAKAGVRDRKTIGIEEL
ncbi:MAG TPA: hypothetical protein VFE05_16990 [Longimicrobiaceae bacterium]|jgi:hypothetical protein|nr:hypothetical protein [Longimicrobiaceae bacterium]